MIIYLIIELTDYAVGPESPPKYSSEPRGRKDGYRRLPEQDYPPNPNYYPPPMQPLPAPVVQQQQSSNTVCAVEGEPAVVWFCVLGFIICYETIMCLSKLSNSDRYGVCRANNTPCPIWQMLFS